MLIDKGNQILIPVMNLRQNIVYSRIAKEDVTRVLTMPAMCIEIQYTAHTRIMKIFIIFGHFIIDLILTCSPSWLHKLIANMRNLYRLQFSVCKSNMVDVKFGLVIKMRIIVQSSLRFCRQ